MMANIEWTGLGLGLGLGLAGGVLLAGLVSALLYARKQKLPDAALALLAGVSLAAMLSGPTRPGSEAGEVSMASDAAIPAGAPASSAGAQGKAGVATSPAAAKAALRQQPDDGLARAILAVPQSGSIALTGYGLREAQWNDLPARPLRWTAPAGPLLRLDFQRTVPLGRSFTLRAHHTQAQPGWRLQLLAENGQLLSESSKLASAVATQAAVTTRNAAGPQPDQLALTWQPPLAETLLLQARVLDGAGKLIAQGPVPLQVVTPLPLQIIGRFGAPSFDARTLNQLLADSRAVLDWQTTLGKGLNRSESASAVPTAPNAQVIDAAYFETLPAPARAALLAQTGQGTPLIVLAGNAADAAIWQRELSLRLTPQSVTTEKEDVRQFSFGAEHLAMPPATLNPADGQGGPWTISAADSKGKPWLWQRSWKQGRIVWIGVADWHRYAISSPAALGQWWQSLLDRSAIGATQKVSWQQPDPMPVAGLRTEVCALGIAPGAALHIDGQPATAWQVRSAKAEAACAAFLPQQAGWLTLRSGDAHHRIYIHGAGDWPLWQQALRHDATQRYAARAPEAPSSTAGPRVPLPSWPFALLLAASLLTLWWRERR